MVDKTSVIVYVDGAAVCAIINARIKASRDAFHVKGLVFFDEGGLNVLGEAYKSTRPRFAIRSNAKHRRQKLLLRSICITKHQRIDAQFIKP